MRKLWILGLCLALGLCLLASIACGENDGPRGVDDMDDDDDDAVSGGGGGGSDDDASDDDETADDDAADDDVADDDASDDDDLDDDDDAVDDDTADDDDDTGDDDMGEPGDIEITASNGSGSLKPDTEYQFLFTVKNNAVPEGETASASVYGLELWMPTADYVPDTNVEATTRPADWNEPLFTQDSEASPYKIYWEYSGWASSNIGDIGPGESGAFSFYATTDDTGTDGFGWFAYLDDETINYDVKYIFDPGKGDIDD
ncbi:hypothetical protein KDL45_07905 [bacterium]|nr:hypothetical protein [bacterium]